MILQQTADEKLILFNPEDLKERKLLDAFPGLKRHGLQYYCVNKPNIVYNIYQRLQRKTKNLKVTSLVKKLTESEIEIKELPDWFKFHTKPLRHQRIALRFAYTFGSFLNLSEPGLGKTKVTLDYIWLLQAKKSLIVCPKSLRFVWEEEAATHRPELSVYVVQTTDWSLEIEHVKRADVVVVNYDKAVALANSLESLQFDFMAVDEGLIKNPSTDRTKALTALSRGIPYRCVMSGTLVNNSPLDVFAPLRFTEPSLVGESFSKFRDEYALVSRKNRFITVGYRNVPEVKDMLASCGIIMTKKEWLKLPPKVFNRKYVPMGDVQRDYYNKLASNYLLQIPELNVEIEVDNPLSVLIKLNQISNGFIYYKDNNEETLDELYGTESRKRSKDNRKTYFFEEQPKIQALLDLIKSEEFNCPKDDGTWKNPDDEPDGDSASETDPSGGSKGGNDGTGPISTQPGVPGSDDGSVNPGSGTETSCGVLTGTDSYGLCAGTADNGSRSENGSANREHSVSDTTDRNPTSVCGNVTLSDGLPTDLGENTPPAINNRLLGERVGHNHISCGEKSASVSTRSANRRAIIWFNLAAERTLIEHALDKAGISFLTIAGGSKDIGATVRRFNKDSSVRFLICQAKTINYGVTIMGTKEEDLAEDYVPGFDPQVSDEIFYSVNFSLEVFLQQQDRIHRIGQTRICRYWMILTNSKIERRIAERLEEKLMCNKEILVDIMDTLGQDMLDS